jgi:hypothetical protein
MWELDGITDNMANQLFINTEIWKQAVMMNLKCSETHSGMESIIPYPAMTKLLTQIKCLSILTQLTPSVDSSQKTPVMPPVQSSNR